MSIGLSDFTSGAVGSGFGVGSQADVAALSKALEAGYQTGANKTGGGALIVESLEQSLKVVTYNANHIRFWKKIPKSPAFNSIEEYNQLISYGGNQNAFVQEGELPQASDSVYSRQLAKVKYLGTVREVTHQMSLMHAAHGDQVALQNQGGILWLLEKIEYALFHGDSSLAFSGESEQWDGLDALIDPGNVIDLGDASLQDADFEEASNIILENYGFPTDVMLGLRANSDYSKTMYSRERWQMPAPVNGQAGGNVGTVATNGGVLQLSPNVFLRPTPAAPTAATSANAPAAPASIAAGAATGTDGEHAKGSPTGTSGDSSFAYVVTALNRFGESAPTAVGSIVTLTGANKAAGVHVPLTITNAGSLGAFLPEYYRVYRSKAAVSTTVPTDMSDYYLIAQVPAASQAGGGTTTFNDVNLVLPGTSTAYVGELTPSVLTFRQLMPLMKMDLAVVGPAYRWLILLYGTPVLFTPKKWVRIINIGRLEAP